MRRGIIRLQCNSSVERASMADIVNLNQFARSAKVTSPNGGRRRTAAGSQIRDTRKRPLKWEKVKKEPTTNASIDPRRDQWFGLKR